MTEKTALITGASSGIGLELARLLAADGYDLVLVARREESLVRLGGELGGRHGIAATHLPVDLAAPEGPEEVFRGWGPDRPPPQVLVNNAGFGIHGAFATADGVDEREMLEVNVAAPTRLLRLFLPGMVRRGSGRILNVASLAAFVPGPLMAVYYATKAYVLHLSEALAEEVAGTGVTVTALCPGPTLTGFYDRAGLGRSRQIRGPWMGSAAGVARAGYRGMMKGRRVVVPGLVNRLVGQSVRVLPRRAVARIVRTVNEARDDGA